MKEFFKVILVFFIISALALILINTSLEVVIKLVIFFLGMKEVLKII